MSLSTATAPELTAEQVQKVLLQPLEAESRFLACGPRIVDSSGPVRFPKMGGPTTVTWVGENEQIPESNADFDELSLMPSTMKSVKTLTRFSNELARQSVVSLDAALKQRLVKDVRDKLDAQFFSASGDGVTTPKGLFGQAGITSVPVGGALTLDSLLAAQGAALDADVNLDATRWVLTPGDFMKLRGLKDGDGRYLIQPDVTAGAGFRLFGQPVTVTKAVPDTTGGTPTGRAGLIDFSQVIVVRDLDASIKVLDQTFGDFDQQALRVVSRWDLGLANPEAVVALTGITRA